MAPHGQAERSAGSSDMDTDQSPSGQSKRPAFHHHESETSLASDHTRDSGNSRDHPRPKQHHHHHAQKHVVGGGGRLHARIPSSKALSKHHGTTTSKNTHRRHASPSPERTTTTTTSGQSYRRVQSEAKISRDSSSSNLKSNASATSLRRNKSHVEVHKRTKSADKLKRTASNPAVNKVKSTTKSTVHFDLGTDGPEDEWVDASGSASPYLSRRGSMASGQSSAKTGGASANSSRPHTPRDQQPSQSQSSPDQATAHHKEYLTSRLLQRTPSQGAPPQMTHDTVSVSRSRSPDSLSRQSTLSNDGVSASAKASTGSAGRDELTSRFVGASSSGGRNDSSFYSTPSSRTGGRQSEEARRPQSAGGTTRAPVDDEADRSALAPRATRRAAPGQSRIQQKLNLQRASSVIEPSQAVGGGMGLASLGMGMGVGTVGATPLVGVGGPGYDGSASRDPRVGKQLEKTGMEYLSVRRYQNPVLRSLDRVIQLQEAKMPRRIPPGRNGMAPLGNGKIHSRPGTGHMRNVSLGSAMPPPERRPVTPRAQSIRTLHSTGAGSSYDGDDGRNGGANGLSGSSLVGGEDEGAADGLNALLRNMWEKNMDLSASQD